MDYRTNRERDVFRDVVRNKRPGTRAFVARPNNGVGAHRSVVLVGCEVTGWRQALKCWDGNHAERAQDFAAEYNAAPIDSRSC